MVQRRLPRAFYGVDSADSEELFKAEFKEFFGEDNEAGEALRDTMGELAREFLSQIKINTITYNATLDVDDDLIDMLADNSIPRVPSIRSIRSICTARCGAVCR